MLFHGKLNKGDIKHTRLVGLPFFCLVLPSVVYFCLITKISSNSKSPGSGRAIETIGGPGQRLEREDEGEGGDGSGATSCVAMLE